MTTPDEHRQERLAARSANYREHIAHLKAIRDEATAEHCSHHVDRNLCIDHRPAKTEGASE